MKSFDYLGLDCPNYTINVMEKGQVSGSNNIRPCDHPGLDFHILSIPGMEAGPVSGSNVM